MESLQQLLHKSEEVPPPVQAHVHHKLQMTGSLMDEMIEWRWQSAA